MLTMLGIPNCDTVRKARKYLDNNSVPYNFRDVRAEPLNLEDWQKLVAQDDETRLLNTKSPTFRKLGVPKEELNPEKTAQFLNENPTCMKRPTMLDGDRLIGIGFSEEQFAGFVK